MIPSIVAEYIDLYKYRAGLSEHEIEEIEDCDLRLNEMWVQMNDYEKDMVEKMLV